MSTGKLKAQYNRVRTSTALHTTSIWSNTIGLQQDQAGTNSAIEASIYAPGGGGRGREAKRQRAQELIDASGFQPSVRDFEGLKALARRSGGNDAALNRGACKMCGGLGHLTKQCRNFLDKGDGQAAAAAADGAAAGGDRQLLTEEDEARLLESDSMDGSDLGSGSDSDSDRDRKRRRKERSSRDKERSSSRKHKKEKSKKHKKEKSKKHKRERRSRSRDRGDRQQERSRSRSRDRQRRERSRSRSADSRA